MAGALTCEDLGEIVTFPLIPSREFDDKFLATPELLLLWRRELLSGFLALPANSLLDVLIKSTPCAWGIMCAGR